MKYVKLTSAHAAACKHLFDTDRFAGVDGEKVNQHMRQWTGGSSFADWSYEAFQHTYLSGLQRFHAFGAIDGDGNIDTITTFFESDRDPSWYYIFCRNKGAFTTPGKLLEAIIEYNEQNGRMKFFTAFNKKHGPLLRRFFPEAVNERYDYFDEMVVPAQTRCHYNTYWEVLFGRNMLPTDTVIRCSFLKNKYRNNLPIGGSL